MSTGSENASVQTEKRGTRKQVGVMQVGGMEGVPGDGQRRPCEVSAAPHEKPGTSPDLDKFSP